MDQLVPESPVLITVDHIQRATINFNKTKQ